VILIRPRREEDHVRDRHDHGRKNICSRGNGEVERILLTSGRLIRTTALLFPIPDSFQADRVRAGGIHIKYQVESDVDNSSDLTLGEYNTQRALNNETLQVDLEVDAEGATISDNDFYEAPGFAMFVNSSGTTKARETWTWQSRNKEPRR
jgi:hypothetical protein